MIKEAETRTAFEPVYHPERPVLVASATQATPVVFYMGERIYFRPLEVSDEPLLRRWVNDPRNWRTLCHRGPINGCREKEWLESQGKTKGEYVFGIVVKDEDRLIGTTGLHAVDPRT